MREMTSLERVQAVLNGRKPDRVPIIPQSFLFAAKTNGYDIGQINRNPRLMAESHRVSQEKYGYDGCIIDVDDAALAEACGAKVIFRPDSVAVVDDAHPAVDDLREVPDLKLPDPAKDGRLCEWMETTERLMDMIGDHVFIMGRADQGPFDVLALLRGPQDFMCDLLTEDEEVILEALKWATQAHIIFAKAMRDISHCTSMGDSYAGPNLVSPEIYRTCIKPHHTRLNEAVKDLGMIPIYHCCGKAESLIEDFIETGDKPYSIHICGDASLILEDMARTGAHLFELDWKVDMVQARRIMPDNAVIMGNVNPSDPMFLGTPDKVLAQSKAIIEGTGGRGLILSAGCALGANTKPENVAALVQAAKLYGTFED